MRNVILAILFMAGILKTGATQATDFPEAWEGKWQGDLHIYTAGGLSQTLPMQLHIQPIDSVTWDWAITYGTDERAALRPYELKIKDREKGLFLIDEKNAIVLEAFLLGGKLYQRFEVMGDLLTASTEKIAGQLIFEIIAGDMAASSVTGGTTAGAESIPEVQSFPVRVRQKAILIKTN